MKALWKYALVLCVGLATPLLITVPAFAEDQAAVDMARQRFKEGVAFFDKKQYDKARVAFLQAYALKPHPAILLNLAQSELRSDREADAATHFAQYLREHGEATEEQRQAAEDGLEAAKQKVGEVKLDVSETGADISVDGNDVGKSPLPDPLYLAPGSYTIRATKGDNSAEATVEVGAGESKSESLTFEAPSPAPSSAPEAEAGEEERPPKEEEEGAEEEEEPEEVAVSKEWQPGDGFFAWYADRPLAWVGTGLTVIAAGAGAAFAVTSRNYYDDADSVSGQIRDAAAQDGLPSTEGVCVMYPVIPQNPDRTRQYQKACSQYQDNVDSGDKYKSYAITSFVLSGLFLAGTVTYYIIDGVVYADSASGSRRRTRVATGPDTLLVPYAGRGLAGLSVVGRF